MASNRGDGQCKNPRLGMNSVVGLCDLTDAILVAILSLLPTKSVVSTSLLSRRWRYLWMSITNLQCSEHLMFHKRRSQFVDFIDRVMVRCEQSSLVSFSLSCKVLGDASRINTWITKAKRCNVEELSLVLIDHDLPSNYVLPCFKFGCQLLVKLDLKMTEGFIMRIPPSFSCMTHLKYLELSWIMFADDESTEKMLSSPLLEELSIEWCDWENIKSVTVYAPNSSFGYFL